MRLSRAITFFVACWIIVFVFAIWLDWMMPTGNTVEDEVASTLAFFRIWQISQGKLTWELGWLVGRDAAIFLLLVSVGGMLVGIEAWRITRVRHSVRSLVAEGLIVSVIAFSLVLLPHIAWRIWWNFTDRVVSSRSCWHWFMCSSPQLSVCILSWFLCSTPFVVICMKRVRQLRRCTVMPDY